MLGIALDIARAGLGVSSDRSAVLSRNVANAGNGLTSRKYANTTGLSGGGATVSSITRASNDSLTRSLQNAMSSAAGQKVVLAALDSLHQTVGDPSQEASPAALLGKLGDALQAFSGNPSDASLSTAAINAAKDLATSLNDASATISGVRTQADSDMAQSVNNVNTLLARFGDLNREIVSGTHDGRDVTDQLDARDDVLRSLSEEIGIKTVARSGNDVAIYTDSGLTLFDREARQVSMQPSVLTPGTAGNAVYVDGVPVTGSGALMRVENGRIAGLAQVRDDISVTYQRQMDEIARGLIDTFSESDQSATPSLPKISGLFTWPGGPAVPSASSVANGLSGVISVNASVDPAAGGNWRLLRDGSIGDPGNAAYTYNASGAAGFSTRILQLADGLKAAQTFDASSGLKSPSGLGDAAASSTSWIEDVRQRASSQSDYRTTLADRARDALSRETGVNLDEEMTALLDVERSYQTTSKLISVVDGMFKTLLESL